MVKFPRAYPDRIQGTFAQKVAIVFVFGAVALALKQLAELAILVFGAVLIAIGMHAAARQISGMTRLSESASLAIAIFLIVAIFGFAIWPFGYVIGSQMDELAKQIPQGLRLAAAEATLLPPVVSLISIIAFAALLGPSAVLVAVPMALLVLVALDVLYVESVLGSSPASDDVGVGPRDDLKQSA